MAGESSPRRSRGFSLIAVFIVIVTILVIIGFGPKYGDQMNARETAVLQEISRINTAQAQYRTQFGKFASSLAQLGHKFTITPTPEGYMINADPKVYNSSGRRSFYSDQSMSLRGSEYRPANASSPEIK